MPENTETVSTFNLTLVSMVIAHLHMYTDSLKRMLNCLHDLSDH